MRFSQLCLVDRRPELSDGVRFQQQMEEVRLLDELGYWAVWFGEHHFVGYALCGDTLMMCAAAARETRRIRLGAGVVVLPFHHPLRVAEQAAMVDCLSNGRLLLGVGRGYQPPEFAGFGLRLEDSAPRFEQGLAVLRRALNEDDFSYEGDFWRGEHVTTWPKPVQQPIPMWAACISDASFERYGRLGFPILTFPSTIESELLKTQIETYRRIYHEHGHDPAAMRIGFTSFTYLEPSAEHANRVFEGAMEHYFGLLDRLTRVEGEAEAAQQVYDRIPTTGRITGSPEEAIERVRWIRDEFGVTDIVNLTHFAGGLSHEQVMGSLRLFAEEVMPAFAEEPAPAAAC
jgi:alkanesulfonate monooxygenase SsuD/methylene tetrahydromethanopterin reductase-like flavin-dependent oxidoreductase (luciferase family)